MWIRLRTGRIRGGDVDFWLASRFASVGVNRVDFTVRFMRFGLDVPGTVYICTVSVEGNTNGNMQEFGLHPCISLKSHIIKIISGDGKSADTAYTIGK